MVSVFHRCRASWIAEIVSILGDGAAVAALMVQKFFHFFENMFNQIIVLLFAAVIAVPAPLSQKLPDFLREKKEEPVCKEKEGHCVSIIRSQLFKKKICQYTKLEDWPKVTEEKPKEKVKE